MRTSLGFGIARVTAHQRSGAEVERVLPVRSSSSGIARSLTAGLATLALATLAGCATTATPASNPLPTTVTSPAPSAPPEATPTLSAEQQRAVEEATQAALAYRQTLVDLYSGARTHLNDLNLVATGDLLDRGLMNTSLRLRGGYRTEPTGAQLVVISAAPKRVNVTKKQPTVIVSVCIDATHASAIGPDGTRIPGVREQLDYTVVKTKHLPAPGWAVKQITSDRKAGQRQC